MYKFVPQSLARPAVYSVFAAVAVLLAVQPPLAAQQPSPLTAAAALLAQQELAITGDRVIEAGEEFDDVVVVRGDLTVRGEIRGDALVIFGDLILEDGGEVDGDALVIRGEIRNLGGRVRGEMRTTDDISSIASIGGGGGGAAAAIREGEVREAAAERVRAVAPERRGRSWFDPIREGFAGLLGTAALGLVLAGVGSLLIFYGRPYLETVSDTVRGSVLRSGGVGLAAGFLIIPAFVVMVVALAVSIVGIPLLLAAVPLYPLLVAAAAGLGLLAVAHAVGERTSEERRNLDFASRNAYSYLFTGLGMLLVPLFLANLLTMTGFLGWIGTLIKVIAFTAMWVAATVGLGAVVLSRAGTRRTFATPLGEQDPIMPDPLFDDEPFSGRAAG